MPRFRSSEYFDWLSEVLPIHLTPAGSLGSQASQQYFCGKPPGSCTLASLVPDPGFHLISGLALGFPEDLFPGSSKRTTLPAKFGALCRVGLKPCN